MGQEPASDGPFADHALMTVPCSYDDIPATLPDTTATKPEDWDDEEDGTLVKNYSLSLSWCCWVWQGGASSCMARTAILASPVILSQQFS